MKKTYKILLIALLIIIINITIINADSEIPAPNAKINEIMIFWKNNKDENDDIWNNISIEEIETWLKTLDAKKEDDVPEQLQDGFTNTKNSLTRILEKKKQEKEKAEEEAQKMQNAWQNIPSKDASAEDINTFVQSATKHKNDTGEDKFSDVDLDVLQAWEKTIGKVLMQYTQTYSHVYYKISARIR